jgi:hypothetical protein
LKALRTAKFDALPNFTLLRTLHLTPSTNLVQISEAAFAGAFNGMNHTHRHTRRWHIRIVAGQDLFGAVLQTRKETHGLVLDALQPHYPKRLLSVAVATREPDLRCKKSLMKAPASTSLSKSMPVSMPMPCSMYTTSSVATLPVAPLA